MRKFNRFMRQPPMPLGKNRTFITGCKAHWALAKQGTLEGTVLLKNNGTLPLAPGAKICLFGSGSAEFILGGGGSGDVNTDKKINLATALQTAADKDKIEFYSPLVDFYRQAKRECDDEARKIYGRDLSYWRRLRNIPTPDMPEDLYQQAKAFGDTAIFCIARYSSEGTDCGDRNGQEGDFDLWKNEQALLDRLCQDFKRVIVVLNTCGPVSTKEYKHNDKVDAVIYATYGGGIAGEALTEIILGERYPSGKLQDTLAYDLMDYPGTEEFLTNHEYQNYTEDIFVGYRYFETFAPEKVAYPYGFGLGFTTFAVTKKAAALEKNTVKLTATVKNTGNFAGKEVVQVYLEAPQGKLGKAKRVLTAFAKTKELKPGEEATLNLSFDIREFGSFDDLGKVVKSAFILEKGEYTVHAGTSVRDTEEYLTFTLKDDIICRRCHEYMAPQDLKERLTADGTMEKLPSIKPVAHKPKRYFLKKDAKADPKLSLAKALEDDRLDDFMAGLPDEFLAEMLYGHPVTNIANTGGIGLTPKARWRPEEIPNVPTADGPAGLRVVYGCGMYTTFFPCATTIAQTWNTSIAQRIGKATASEVKENNVGIWLSPALNIHRHPLCGRNFEYYSEDPLVSGLFATACVKGVQSINIAATVKHYCANNKEINRKCVDSRVSQRALREIYLRGFEIVVKKARPWALMSSYNPINGVQSSSNWESINGILRGEWKYDGIVMTDWTTFAHLEDELYAGNDVKMPGMISLFYPQAHESYDLAGAISDGTIDRNVVYASVRRIFKMMEHLE